jgi:two-component system, NarL family, sensor histidine kinase UhpB
MLRAETPGTHGQVEETLRRQKELLQIIFNHLPVMICFICEDRRLQLVNREWESVLGWSIEEVVSQKIDLEAELFPDPQAREFARDFARNSSGEWRDFRTRVKDGRIIDTSWAVVRLSDGALICIGQDITGRKQAEQELQRQTEILKTIFDHIPIMINFVDQNERLKLVNREWERTLGWSLAEIESQNIDILEENYPDPGYRQEVRDFVRHSTAEWKDFKTRARDGRVIDTSWATLHLSDGSGIGIGQDITERKRAEEALRESEERFRGLAENINEVFWLRSPDFKQLLYISPMYERVCGKSRESLQGKGLDLPGVHPEDRARLLEMVENFSGREFEIEYRILTKDGDMRWLRDRGFPIRNQAGEIYRIGGVAEDITERKEAEDRLKASREQLRALSASLQSAREKEAARIAHQIHDDLGGLLTSLRWELEALDKMIQQPAGEQLSRTMRDKLANMVALTDTTIDTVRRLASELRPTILDDLGLIEAIEWHTQQFQARTGIECRCDSLVENLALSEEQSTALFRIVQEALTNILRHARATQVTIAITQEAGLFVLAITDNGRGITPAETANRSSLGLLGMQERAHLIGGEVEISGESGQGTRLRVQVPLMAASNARGAQ